MTAPRFVNRKEDFQILLISTNKARSPVFQTQVPFKARGDNARLIFHVYGKKLITLVKERKLNQFSHYAVFVTSFTQLTIMFAYTVPLIQFNANYTKQD